jgi:hypothetical protein
MMMEGRVVPCNVYLGFDFGRLCGTQSKAYENMNLAKYEHGFHCSNSQL